MSKEKNRFLEVKVAGCQRDGFGVLHLSAVEAFSAPFCFELDLLSNESQPVSDFTAQSVDLFIGKNTTKPRHIKGIVKQIVRKVNVDRFGNSRYTMQVVPDLQLY